MKDMANTGKVEKHGKGTRTRGLMVETMMVGMLKVASMLKMAMLRVASMLKMASMLRVVSMLRVASILKVTSGEINQVLKRQHGTQGRVHSKDGVRRQIRL